MGPDPKEGAHQTDPLLTSPLGKFSQVPAPTIVPFSSKSGNPLSQILSRNHTTLGHDLQVSTVVVQLVELSRCSKQEDGSGNLKIQTPPGQSRVRQGEKKELFWLSKSREEAETKVQCQMETWLVVRGQEGENTKRG